MTTEQQEATPPPDDTMTLTEHLGELRMRIIRSALAVIVGMVFIIAFYDQVLDFLVQPYVDLCASKDPGFCDPELLHHGPDRGPVDPTAGRHVRRHHPGAARSSSGRCGASSFRR